MTRICKKCFVGVEAESYEALIEKALGAIPKRDKTSDADYASRIALCEACGYLTAATCQACGCYVELRAAKKASHCPYKKW